MKVPSAIFFRPSSMAMWGGAASALVWMVPMSGEYLTGYTVPTRPSVLGILLVLEWYVVIFATMRLGESIGLFTTIFDLPKSSLVSIDSKWLLRWLTALTALGLGATYAKVLNALSLSEIGLYLVSGYANELKESLYEDYSIGLLSLRYLAMFSITLSVYRFVKLRRLDPLLILNVILLALSAILSQRLILVASVVGSLFVIYHGHRYLHVQIVKLAIFSLAIFAILALLNYSRNSNYYASDGVEFWQAGMASIVTYVGSPFQVMLSVANFPDGVVGEAIEAYRNFTDISETLNSNSSFVALHESIGYWAWPYIATVSFIAGFVFSKCRKPGETALLLPASAVIYASAELWRLDLFSKGIFLVWLTIGISLPIAMGIAGKFWRSGHPPLKRGTLGPRPVGNLRLGNAPPA